jgi:hypothetical protein
VGADVRKIIILLDGIDFVGLVALTGVIVLGILVCVLVWKATKEMND